MKGKLSIKVLFVWLFSLFFFLFINFKVEALESEFENFSKDVVDLIRTYEQDEGDTDRPYHTKRLIVKTREEIDLKGAIDYVRGSSYYILQYETEADTENALFYYKSLSAIEYVEPDFIFETSSVDESSAGYISWGAEAMGVGSYTDYLLSEVGEENLEEIIVAVLDTGIDTDHPWFVDRIADGGQNYSSSTNSSGYSYEDVRGHGTHVSGIIADLTLDNVKILPIKVLNNQGKAYSSNILLGVQYVINQKKSGKKIYAMNLSFGASAGVGSYDYNLYVDALNEAYAEGVLPIVAAGNDGQNVAYHTPANVPCAITVSAVAKSSTSYSRPAWSNYGAYVDVSAPGDVIYSAAVGGGIVGMSGTSMATPHVTAAVALLYSDTSMNYTIENIENVLDSSSVDLGDSGWDQYYGEGMVSLKYAYTKIIDPVEFSDKTRDHSSSFRLELSSKDNTASIYYTLDGTIPSVNNGVLYTGPITVSKSVKVQAIAYVLVDGVIKRYSKISSYVYCINGQDVENPYDISKDGILLAYKGILDEIIVPNKINGIEVVAIGNCAFSSSNIVKITFPSTVLEIEDYAFSGLTSLEEVFASNVIRIGESSFSNCSKLKNVYIPKVINIDSKAFYGCSSLSSLILPASLSVVGEFAIGYTIEGTLIANFTIYGYVGSASQIYADAVGIKFIKLDEFEFVSDLPSEIVIRETDSEKYLSVSVKGYKLQYTWFVLEQLGDDPKEISNSNSPVLYLDLSYAHNKYYFVKISQWDGEVLDSNICKVLAQGVYIITATSGVGGSISPSGKVYVNEGGTQKFYFVPDVGFSVKNIIVNNVVLDGENLQSAIQNGYTFSGVYSDHSISVHYRKIVYTIEASGGINGTISPNGKNLVEHGDSLLFTFIANEGYHVESIVVDGIYVLDIKEEYLFYNVTGNHNIHVTFSINTYVLTSTSVGGGSISPKGEITLDHGKNITYSIVPNEGNYISRIEVDGISLVGVALDLAKENQSYTFNEISKNHTIRVVFEKNVYTVVSSTGNNGNISPKGNISVSHGNNQLFVFEAFDGYHVSQIKVDNEKLDEQELEQAVKNGYAFIDVVGNHSIEVSFMKNMYTVTSVSGDGGNITPVGDTKVMHGESLTFIVNSLSGYNVSQIKIDGEAISSAMLQKVILDGYVFESINSNHTIEVIFEKNVYTIVSKSEKNGQIYPNGATQVKYQESQKFEITPEYGYHISQIVVDGEELDAEQVTSVIKNGFVFENVNKNHTIEVGFSKNIYSIIAVGVKEGVYSPSGNIHVEHGRSQSVMLATMEGYDVTKIKVDNIELKKEEIDKVLVNGYTFNNVVDNHVIEVFFEKPSFTIFASSEGEGEIAPFGEVKVKEGESAIFSFNGKDGYGVDKLIVDGKVVECNGKYVFENVARVHSIIAVFKKHFKIEVNGDSNGVVTPSKYVTLGKSATFEFEGKEGYIVKDVVIDGYSVGSVSSFTFENVDSSHKVNVIFELMKLTVNIEIEGLGQIECEKSLKIINYGDKREIKLLPSKRYIISKVICGEKELEVVDKTIVLENITSNLNLKVVFEKKAGGLSCSKSSGSMKSGVEDLVFMLFSVIGICFVNKKYLKIK